MSSDPSTPPELLAALFSTTGCYLHSQMLELGCPLCRCLADHRDYLRSFLVVGKEEMMVETPSPDVGHH